MVVGDIRQCSAAAVALGAAFHRIPTEFPDTVAQKNVLHSDRIYMTKSNSSIRDSFLRDRTSLVKFIVFRILYNGTERQQVNFFNRRRKIIVKTRKLCRKNFDILLIVEEIASWRKTIGEIRKHNKRRELR